MIAIAERTFGILALVAVFVTVGTLVALVTRRVPTWLSEDLSLPLATSIAAVATGGSLLLSEVAGYTPCVLCWYQRIAMYPLVIIVGVAAWRRDRDVWRTALPLSVIGAIIAVWHIVIERRPELGGVCDPSASCALRWVEEFGFLTLPTMALIAFAAVATLTLAAHAAPASEGDPRVDQHPEETAEPTS